MLKKFQYKGYKYIKGQTFWKPSESHVNMYNSYSLSIFAWSFNVFQSMVAEIVWTNIKHEMVEQKYFAYIYFLFGCESVYEVSMYSGQWFMKESLDKK
jgi:hypothetical protein